MKQAFASFKRRKPMVKNTSKIKDLPFKYYNCDKRGHQKAECTLRRSE